MSRSFNEDTRVKFPAIIHFLRLGYQYLSLKDLKLHPKTKIALDIFKNSLGAINNREFTEAEAELIANEIFDVTNIKDAGKEFYNWLINPNPEQVKLIDFENLSNNQYHIVTEMYFGKEAKGSFRPDITILINGIPLSFLEVKKPNNAGGVQAEFNRMIRERLPNKSYRNYFNMIQYTTFSNNMEYMDREATEEFEMFKAGSFYATPNGKRTTFSPFREEYDDFYENLNLIDQNIDVAEYILKDNNYSPAHYATPEFQTNLKPDTPCNRFISSFYNIERFMFLLRYGIMYVDSKEVFGKYKVCMRYPQYYAVQGVMNLVKYSNENAIKSGICWMSAGVGKTNLASFVTPVLKDYYAKLNKKLEVYFVVDRLDLLLQTAKDFEDNNMDVYRFNSVREFTNHLQGKNRKTFSKSDSIGEIAVVNIHKFSKEDLNFNYKSGYKEEVQRVFFVDEAHRSYGSDDGEFYENLMKVGGNDSLFIALTATPILETDNRNSTKNKFGEYLYKYFFDKSVKDGYTLKIFREKLKISLVNDEDKHKKLTPSTLKDMHLKEEFIKDVSEYIDNDLKEFRRIESDKTLSAMVVCSSVEQVYKIQEWFSTNSDLRTDVVTSKETSEHNKRVQETYKNYNFENEEDNIDIVIVFNMLITGFSSNRLKKLYLLRTTTDHNLIQTISRINRPYYHYETNSRYNYGYLVDFADIKSEFQNAMEEYMKELDKIYESNSDTVGLYIDTETILKDVERNLEEIHEQTNTDNKEEFSRNLNNLNDKDLNKLLKNLTHVVSGLKDIEIAKSDTETDLESSHFRDLYREVKSHINLRNYQEKGITTKTDEIPEELLLNIQMDSTEILDFTFISPEQEYLFNIFKGLNAEIHLIVVTVILEKLKNLKDKNLVESFEADINEVYRNYTKYVKNVELLQKSANVETVEQAKEDLAYLNKQSEKIDEAILTENEKINEFNGLVFYELFTEYLNDEEYSEEIIKDKILYLSKIYKNYPRFIIRKSKDTFQKSYLNLIGRYFISLGYKDLASNFLKDKGLYIKLIDDIYEKLKREGTI